MYTGNMRTYNTHKYITHTQYDQSIHIQNTHLHDTHIMQITTTRIPYNHTPPITYCKQHRNVDIANVHIQLPAI